MVELKIEEYTKITLDGKTFDLSKDQCILLRDYLNKKYRPDDWITKVVRSLLSVRVRRV